MTKCILVVSMAFLYGSFLYSMELVPLLEKNRSEKKNIFFCDVKFPLLHYVLTSLPEQARPVTARYIERLWEQDNFFVEIDLSGAFKNKKDNCLRILEKHNKMPQCGDNCACDLKGAGFGGCCGFTTASVGLGLYGFLDGCMWFWCDIMTPVHVMSDLMCYGLPVCTCVGCVVGGCCVVTGCSKSIHKYFE